MTTGASKFAKKVTLESLKSDLDNLDIDELETTPVTLSKLSDAVKKKLLQRLNIINQLKKLVLFRLLMLVI